MKYSKFQSSKQSRRGSWIVAGVLMVVGLMIWVAGTSWAATNNTANNTDDNAAEEKPIDWGRLQEEVEDTSGLKTRLNEIQDRENEALAKINGTFDKEVEKILANKKLSEKSKNSLLKNALKKKLDATKRAKATSARAKSLADGSWKAQKRSAGRIIRTYQSGGYWNPPVSSGGGSSGGSSQPMVLPCVDLDSIKPKLPSPTPLPGSPTLPTVTPSTTMTAR